MAPALLWSLIQFWSASAHAQPSEPVDLEWSAPADCPGLAEVQAGIRKLAGPRKLTALSLHAEATVTRKDDGNLHLRLVLHAGDMVEERNITASSCSALAGATAVAVGLLFRSGAIPTEDERGTLPSTGDQGTGGTGGKPATTPDAPGPPPTTEPPTTKPEEPRTTHRLNGLAQVPLAMFGLGPLRAPSLGIAVAGGASIDQWRFLLRGTAWLPEHVSRTDDFQQYGAEVQRTSLTLLSCRTLLHSRFEVAPCATLSLAHLSARGEGAHIAPRTAQVTWVAAGLGLHARFHVVSWLSLLLVAEGELAGSRPELVLGGVGPVETLLPGAATLGLGSEWIF